MFLRLCLVLFVCISLGSLPSVMMGGCNPPGNPDGGNNDNSPSDSNPGPLDPQKLGVKYLCPGAEGCLQGKGQLEVGVAMQKITPTNYERARFSYFVEKGFCPEPTPKSAFGLWRCSELHDLAQYGRKDCGLDGICPGDKIKTRVSCKDAPCADGLTCNDTDKFCYIEYKEPDKDGSEKDGVPDWFIDCGKDGICPCLDPSGQGAYYGKDKKCLTGHTTNPEYKGPDADGTEGNGKFDGVWMGGFSGNHPLQGFHDDIWARVVVFRTGETTVALVSLDLVGFFYNQVQKTREQVDAKLSKGTIDYVLVSSTHVHEGPDTMGLWGRHESGIPAESGADPAYLEFIRNKVVEAIAEAHGKLQPARMFAATTQTGGQGFIRDSRDPVVIDDTLNVLQFVTKDGDKPITTIVNWGNHPEVLSDTNNYLTSDFPHYIREAIEKGIEPKGTHKGAPAIGGMGFYLQASVGGLMTPLGIPIPDIDGTPQDKSDWNKAKALGNQVVLKAHEALTKKEEIVDPEITLWAKDFLLTMENRYYHIGFNLKLFHRDGEGYDADSPINKNNLPKVRTEVALIRLGPVTLYSVPGEIDAEVLLGGYDGKFSFGYPLVDPNNSNKPDLSKAPQGPYLKEKIPGKYKLLVGLGNDELGYMIPLWNWQLNEKQPYLEQAPGDHYEETNSVGPQTIPDLLGIYDLLLKLADPTKK